MVYRKETEELKRNDLLSTADHKWILMVLDQSEMYMRAKMSSIVIITFYFHPFWSFSPRLTEDRGATSNMCAKS